MRLVIHREWPGRRLFWADASQVIMAAGYQVLAVKEDGSQRRLASFPVSLPERLAAVARVTRQGLRLGLHHVLPLPDGSLVAIAKKRLLRADPGSPRFRVVGALRHGNKPGHRGVCLDDQGWVYYGEYSLNMDRSLASGLYRSQDGGRTYQLLHDFPPGQVRHIHFVQWDNWAKCLWLGTGDADPECRLLRSTDRGESWETVGSGSQLWRAVGVTFTPDAVFWGTDAGSDAGTTPNYVVRLDRSTLQTETMLEVQGPCHGTGSLCDGTLVVSTGVEGGINEKDNRAHLWASRDGKKWEELANWKKDAWPYILQFGVIHFPNGLQNSDRLYFTTRALQGAGETGFAASIEG